METDGPLRLELGQVVTLHNVSDVSETKLIVAAMLNFDEAAAPPHAQFWTTYLLTTNNADAGLDYWLHVDEARPDLIILWRAAEPIKVNWQPGAEPDTDKAGYKLGDAGTASFTATGTCPLGEAGSMEYAIYEQLLTGYRLYENYGGGWTVSVGTRIGLSQIHFAAD